MEDDWIYFTAPVGFCDSDIDLRWKVDKTKLQYLTSTGEWKHPVWLKHLSPEIHESFKFALRKRKLIYYNGGIDGI